MIDAGTILGLLACQLLTIIERMNEQESCAPPRQLTGGGSSNVWTVARRGCPAVAFPFVWREGLEWRFRS
jgi:hypothetical protein